MLLVALDVEGLEPGIYRVLPERSTLQALDLPLDRERLAVACKGQRFINRANAFLVITLDFARLRKPGAYRVAGLDAGVVGQLAYIGAEAVGGGCCGIGAFLDDELSALLGLDGHEHTAFYGLTLALK